FEADFRLILSNCYTCNPPESDIVKLAKGLEVIFDHKWDQKEEAIAAAAAAHHHKSVDMDDEERIIALNRQIQVLQNELHELLTRRNKSHHSSSVSSKQSSKPRTPRTSAPSNPDQPMTYEEKRALSMDVNAL